MDIRGTIQQQNKIIIDLNCETSHKSFAVGLFLHDKVAFSFDLMLITGLTTAYPLGGSSSAIVSFYKKPLCACVARSLVRIIITGAYHKA